MSQQTVAAESTEVSHQPVGRRERKKQATWLSLHDSAIALSVEKGFEHVTVEEICDRADVSVRTFFNYFPCKEDAVLGGTQGFEDVVDQLRQRPADESPVEALRQVYLERLLSLADHTEYAARVRTRQQLIADNEALRMRDLARIGTFENTLATVVADRIGSDVARDSYPGLVAAVAMSVLRTAFRAWQEDPTLDLPTLVDRGFRAVQAGLPTP